MDYISTLFRKKICLEDLSRHFINIIVQVLLELHVIYMCCTITKNKHSLHIPLKWYQRRLCKPFTQESHDNGLFSANFLIDSFFGFMWSYCHNKLILTKIIAISQQKSPALSILSVNDFNLEK